MKSKERKKKERELDGGSKRGSATQGLICGIVDEDERWTAKTDGGDA
jgi:hypothetical protein